MTLKKETINTIEISCLISVRINRPLKYNKPKTAHFTSCVNATCTYVNKPPQNALKEYYHKLFKDATPRANASKNCSCATATLTVRTTKTKPMPRASSARLPSLSDVRPASVSFKFVFDEILR